MKPNRWRSALLKARLLSPLRLTRQLEREKAGLEVLLPRFRLRTPQDALAAQATVADDIQ